MIIRDSLTSPRTYYVRTDGSDSNTGLTNDAAGAFFTIQHAVDVVCDTIDNMGYAVTIQVADGAYNSAVVLKPYVGSGRVTLQGNTTTPANVSITLSSGICVYALNIPQIWTLAGFKLSTTGSATSCVALFSATLFLDRVDFGPCVHTHIYTDERSRAVILGNYTISGGAVAHVLSMNCSAVMIGGVTATLTGTPAFTYFVGVTKCGVLMAEGALVFSGSATGMRYDVNKNGVVSTYGKGANFFPGSTAGTTSTGGQYT